MTENTMVKWKRTNNDLQSTTQKVKDWATWTPLKIEGALRCSGRFAVSVVLVTYLWHNGNICCNDLLMLFHFYSVYQLLMNIIMSFKLISIFTLIQINWSTLFMIMTNICVLFQVYHYFWNSYWRSCWLSVTGIGYCDCF